MDTACPCEKKIQENAYFFGKNILVDVWCPLGEVILHGGEKSMGCKVANQNEI